MMLAALLSSFQTEECEQSVPGGHPNGGERGLSRCQAGTTKVSNEHTSHGNQSVFLKQILDILGEKIRLILLFSFGGTSGHPAYSTVLGKYWKTEIPPVNVTDCVLNKSSTFSPLTFPHLDSEVMFHFVSVLSSKFEGWINKELILRQL